MKNPEIYDVGAEINKELPPKFGRKAKAHALLDIK